jgi:transposase
MKHHCLKSEYDISCFDTTVLHAGHRGGAARSSKSPFEKGFHLGLGVIQADYVDAQRHEARMAAIERKTKRYPTDLTEEEWAKVAPLLPRRSTRGRPREVDLREIMNAIRYLVRTGCGWRMLPKDFPPWETVYWCFRRFVRQLLFQTIHDVALMLDRERAGREASPSAGILDSQSVKARRPVSGATMPARRSSAASVMSPSTVMGGC